MPMSPRKSGGGNSEEEEMSDVDQGDELLDHVRQLIVDLLVDDSRLSANCPLGEVAGHQGEQRDDRRGSKHQSNNPEEDAAAATRREQVLEEKLARTLLELAGEQDNLRLAANAGNTLLEQLRGAREEIDTLQDELEAVQVTTERSERDTQRLRDQNAALENELQRYVPYSSWESSGDQMPTCRSSRRGSLRESFHRSINDGNDACDLCASRETEVIQLEQRADEFRRRCLELELASERDQQRARELCEEVAQLQQRSEDERLKTARLQHDLDFVTTQLDRRTEEAESARAARDALRRTVRRLEAENEEICTRLVAREEHITKLENSKARTGTQIQVAENRAASAQAETKRVLETLQQLQKQLELRQQHMSGQIGDTGKGDNETEVAPQEKEDRDMEQLLQDATREVTALRLENRFRDNCR
ncbi:hypothetical protein BBJ29_007128 [Phytophthora kernoviae]|uniref:Uncharacterized protein n=1 Tax=Phytophthora kernoviae TaxID=325452 RepID=A0A3R7H4D2_9STRA|nr:hypothetical protein BBJ29_007128 [Phytophthora kernoviae]